MILDLKEVSKLEAKYRNDHAALSALYNMVDIASKLNEDDFLNPSVATTTLTELGVLKMLEGKKEVEQLNS